MANEGKPSIEPASSPTGAESIRAAPAIRGQAAVGARGAKPEQPSFTALAQELAGTMTTRGIAVVANDEPEVMQPPPTAQAAEAPFDEPVPIPVLDWTATSLTLLVVE